MPQARSSAEERSSTDSVDRDSLVLLLKYLRKSLSIQHLDNADAIHSAGQAVRALLAVRPGAVKELAYKKLNVFPFKDVPLCWRRAFEEACLWLILKDLEAVVCDAGNYSSAESTVNSATHDHNILDDVKNSTSLREWVDGAVRLCDEAIIFTGAPLRRAVIDVILEWLELEAPACLLRAKSYAVVPDLPLAAQRYETNQNHSSKRRRLSAESQGRDFLPAGFPAVNSRIIPVLRKEREIKRVKRPSLSEFEQHVQNAQTPLILSDSIDLWPAVKRWKNPQYWLRQTLNGRRLVPVELGNSYTDDTWGQRIMSFKEFLEQHLLLRGDGIAQPDDAIPSGEKDPRSTGYLAQHDLFAQIPALRNDIAVPDYCYVNTTSAASSENDATSEDAKGPSDPQLNIWLGPAGTTSPAHTDPHHNIFAQVFGRKYVRLFAPSQTPKMYPMNTKPGEDTPVAQLADVTNTHGVDMGNTSSVDVGSFVTFKTINGTGSPVIYDPGGQTRRLGLSYAASTESFPLHHSAEYVEAVLEPGECLYIPRGWWHYIRSLETSCNVSFWWDKD